MAYFEAFHYIISSSINALYLKSGPEVSLIFFLKNFCPPRNIYMVICIDAVLILKDIASSVISCLHATFKMLTLSVSPMILYGSGMININYDLDSRADF